MLIAADQISKWWVTQHALSNTQDLSLFEWILNAPQRLEPKIIEITSFFNLVMVWNFGVSFGMFSENSAANLWILLAVSGALTIGLSIWLFKNNDVMQNCALIFIISGAIGNIIDRIRFGAVIDFIDLHAGGHHWPAFNIADSLIVLGACILLTHAFFFDKSNEKTLQAKAEEG